MAAPTPPAVSVPRVILYGLEAIARVEKPREMCALLTGPPAAEGDAVSVGGAVQIANASDTPETAFDMPSGELIDAYGMVEKTGRAVVGIYHSHPASGAVPSRTDVRMMQSNPVAWIIYSIRDGESRAYASDGDGGQVEIRLDRTE